MITGTEAAKVRCFTRAAPPVPAAWARRASGASTGRCAGKIKMPSAIRKCSKHRKRQTAARLRLCNWPVPVCLSSSILHRVSAEKFPRLFRLDHIRVVLRGRTVDLEETVAAALNSGVKSIIFGLGRIDARPCPGQIDTELSSPQIGGRGLLQIAGRRPPKTVATHRHRERGRHSPLDQSPFFGSDAAK